jgi:peptidoglycan/LPS O-acetylase OafA/YrhL
MKYLPALDTLRCLAVLVVAAFHARTPGFGGGFLGVDIFFVLSGFLITTILWSEAASTGRIKLPTFYTRRLARLYPALAGCLVLYIFLAPIAWPSYSGHMRDSLLSVFYLVDFSKSIYGTPKYLSHIWSLSVEFHFYLIWPLVILLLAKMKITTAIKILAMLYVAATFWRLDYFSEAFWNPAYYRFDTRLSGLVAGSLVALVAIHASRFRAKFYVAIFGCALITWAISISQWGEISGISIGIVSAEIGAGLLIIYLSQEKNQHSLLIWKPIVYMGKLSYGIYLFHYPIMIYLRKSYDWPITLVVGLSIAVALAALSYHTVESLFRAKKSAPAIQEARD